MVEMKFIEYIEERIKDEKEFDAVIGDVDMPATFCFSSDWKITDYCKQKYADLLNSEIEVLKDPTGLYTECVEVLYDDEEIGEIFCYAVAGYISEGEWERLFIEGEAVEE